MPPVPAACPTLRRECGQALGGGSAAAFGLCNVGAAVLQSAPMCPSACPHRVCQLAPMPATPAKCVPLHPLPCRGQRPKMQGPCSNPACHTSKGRWVAGRLGSAAEAGRAGGGRRRTAQSATRSPPHQPHSPPQSHASHPPSALCRSARRQRRGGRSLPQVLQAVHSARQLA